MALTIPTFTESPVYNFGISFYVDGIQVDFGMPWGQDMVNLMTDSGLVEACQGFSDTLHAAYPDSLIEYEVYWYSSRIGPVTRATAYEAVVPE
ncbi:hypothetical protein QFZ58_002039 [Streptomyces sp. B1I3]|nr:hypothetical protein [Streptomyces sp. B1I3]